MYRSGAALLLCFSLFQLVDCSRDVEWSDDDEWLNVFVVPHSHNDPGWWYTIESYYQKWTKGIISSVVTALSQDPRRTFIWCETSFFSRWWQDQNETTRNKVKNLVEEGRLEFVGGGWVMNDEASVDIHQIINQFTAGHTWLVDHIGEAAIPTIGWSIDPFGHSSAMAWAQREMGFDGMVINRVHNDIKTNWNANQKLEFAWDRPWNMGNRSCVQGNNNEQEYRWEGEGMLTHMLAYKLYDIPNTCGPDWDICATFDFERPVSKPITSSNVRERSLTLLDQYKKKHDAFSHNNLLVPLGDDFKYKTLDMTVKMMDSYQMMFDYMNSDPSLKVNIRFATLREYMAAVKRSSDPKELPRYDEDFFTYSDRDNDYWSGYFSTRPYLKKAIRTTEAKLRSAQILYSVAHSILSQPQRESYFSSLENCSQILALLQHHDAITGTAKQVVANDYIQLINDAKFQVQELTAKVMETLLCVSDDESFIDVTERQTSTLDPNTKLLSIAEVQKVVLFNPLGQGVTQSIRILVDSCSIIVKDEAGNPLPGQIVPLIEDGEINSHSYWLYIHVSMTGLSWRTLTVESGNSAEISSLYDIDGTTLSFCTGTIASPSEFTLSFGNSFYELSVDPVTAQLASVSLVGSSSPPLELNQEFRMYQTRGGSYLFKPVGESVPIDLSLTKSFIIRGSLLDMATSYSSDKKLGCTTILHHSGTKSLDMRIEVNYSLDLGSSTFNNKEVVSRITTNLKGKNFLTDSAGLDLIKRSFKENTPISSTFYPLTSLAVKKDDASDLQLSILVGQSLGMGSRGEGIFEFMLDRRTMQDDARGMGEKVTDQKKIEIAAVYLLESFSHDIDLGVSTSIIPQFNYPIDIHTITERTWKAAECQSHFSLLAEELPENINLFSMAPSSSSSSNIVFRFAQLNSLAPFGTEMVDLRHVFSPILSIDSIEEKTLSLLHTVAKNVQQLSIPSMSVRTFVASLQEDGDKLKRTIHSPISTEIISKPNIQPSPEPAIENPRFIHLERNPAVTPIDLGMFYNNEIEQQQKPSTIAKKGTNDFPPVKLLLTHAQWYIPQWEYYCILFACTFILFAFTFKFLLPRKIKGTKHNFSKFV